MCESHNRECGAVEARIHAASGPVESYSRTVLSKPGIYRTSYFKRQSGCCVALCERKKIGYIEMQGLSGTPGNPAGKVGMWNIVTYKKQYGFMKRSLVVTRGNLVMELTTNSPISR